MALAECYVKQRPQTHEFFVWSGLFQQSFRQLDVQQSHPENHRIQPHRSGRKGHAENAAQKIKSLSPQGEQAETEFSSKYYASGAAVGVSAAATCAGFQASASSTVLKNPK